MIELTDIQPGYYIARKKEEPDSEFLVVVWSIYPFLQIYALSTELGERPSYQDVRVQDCEFLARIPTAKELLSRVSAK